MDSVEKATQTQLANIEKRSGKNLVELTKFVRESGLFKHGQVRDLLKATFGLGFGDASVLAAYTLKQIDPNVAQKDDHDLASIVDGFYSGPKAHLRPIHDAVMDRIANLGEFEIAPKKTYLSLRRKRQFAMLGPGSSTRVDLGLNMKSVAPKGRLAALPPGGMCQYQVRLTSIDDVDEELMGWIKTAYESAA